MPSTGFTSQKLTSLQATTANKADKTHAFELPNRITSVHRYWNLALKLGNNLFKLVWETDKKIPVLAYKNMTILINWTYLTFRISKNIDCP